MIEIRPASAGGKGRTLERLLARESPGSVVVLGDDVSDAEAFRVLLDARGAGRVAGVTIGIRGGAETPPAVVESADVVLPSPHDAARILSALARDLERRLRPTSQAIAAAVPVELATAAEPAPRTFLQRRSTTAAWWTEPADATAPPGGSARWRPPAFRGSWPAAQPPAVALAAPNRR